MFNYYGSKSKIVHLYPTPKYDDINEPFAGSARYSLKFWDRNITLIDKYPVIVEVWKYLQQASVKDILGLPKLKKGMLISDIKTISKEEKLLLGFLAGQGGMTPRNKVSPRSDFKELHTPNLYKNLASNLYKIKHWKIICGDYRDLENKNATWFIDPPYQFGGHKYKESNKNINFKKLADWCKSRKGQTIVCENTKADWMNFKPMKQMRGIQFETTEAIWSNLETAYDWQQRRLF